MESVKTLIVKDPHGNIIKQDSFSVVGDVGVTIDGEYGEPSATPTYLNGVLDIAFHNLKGNGIASMEQTKTSTEDGGENEWTVTLNSGDVFTMSVFNGHRGEKGNDGNTVILNTEPGDPSEPDHYKLYTDKGANNDGAMTQKAVTDELERLEYFSDVFIPTNKVNSYVYQEKWYGGNAVNDCYLFKVKPGDTFKCENTGNNPVGYHILFLASNSHTAGDTPDYADEYTPWYTTTQVLVAPAGTKYMYVRAGAGSGVDSTPTIHKIASVKSVVKGIVDASSNITDSFTTELIAGSLFNANGEIFGDYSGYATNKRVFATPNYIKTDGNENVTITGHDSSTETCKVFQYDKDFGFISVTAASTLQLTPETRYLKFEIILNNTNGRYDYSRRLMTVTGVKERYVKNTIAASQQSPRYIWHIYEIEQPSTDNMTGQVTATYSGNNGGKVLNRGYIYLPPNYRPEGEPVPLIIHCHGTSGFNFKSGSLPYNNNYVKFLADCGYAVIGCSTNSELYGIDAGTVDGDLVHPLGFACIKSLYDYMTKLYNVRTDGCYIFGFSAGGMYSIMLSQLGQIPIKAAASLAGSVDMFCNMRICLNSLNQRWLTLLGIDFTIPNSSGSGISTSGQAQKTVHSDVKEYVLTNFDKFVGYNPFWYGSDLNKSEFYAEYFDIENKNADIDGDTTLQSLAANAKLTLKVPLKIWHAVDDWNVPIAMTKLFRRMALNGGSICNLREIPSGYGGHYAVGYSSDDSLTPKVDYVTPLGETKNVSISYAEMVDWFKRW